MGFKGSFDFPSKTTTVLQAENVSSCMYSDAETFQSVSSPTTRTEATKGHIQQNSFIDTKPSGSEASPNREPGNPSVQPPEGSNLTLRQPHLTMRTLTKEHLRSSSAITKRASASIHGANHCLRYHLSAGQVDLSSAKPKSSQFRSQNADRRGEAQRDHYQTLSSRGRKRLDTVCFHYRNFTNNRTRNRNSEPAEGSRENQQGKREAWDEPLKSEQLETTTVVSDPNEPLQEQQGIRPEENGYLAANGTIGPHAITNQFTPMASFLEMTQGTRGRDGLFSELYDDTYNSTNNVSSLFHCRNDINSNNAKVNWNGIGQISSYAASQGETQLTWPRPWKLSPLHYATTITNDNDPLTVTPVDSNPRKSGDPENIQVDTNIFALVRISHVEKLHDCNF